MSTFDVDAWQASQQRWGVKLDGREYFARPVSAPAVVAAHLELQGAGLKQERRIMLRLLRLAFPRRLTMLWLGDPVKLLNQLSRPAFREVTKSFFAFVTGNPVTDLTVLGPSRPTWLSPLSSESPDEGSPPTP